MTAMLAHVQALAAGIGPRGTGTAAEAAAADYVAGCLAAAGLPLERQSFRAVASQNAFPLAIDGLALLALVVYGLGGTTGRWLAAALALGTAPLLWQTIRTSGGPLRLLLAWVTSHNVLARVEPQAGPAQTVVLLAHLDTNRCRLAWQSAAVRLLEPLTYLTLALLGALGLLLLVGALLGGPPWLWWLLLVPAVYVAATVVTLIRDDHVPYSPGAHDNAASVAVALEIGARLAARPLSRTCVWLAFTGAEETDHAGLYALLRRYRSELSGAAFIGLEGLGSGDLVYLTEQGVCAHYRPDAGLLALAGRAAGRHPELEARPARMIGEDEVGTLRRAGYRAICLAGRDPAAGTLPHWHRAGDTVDTVSAQFLERAAGLVLALLDEIDGGHLENNL